MGKFRAAWKVATKFVDKNLPTILSAAALVGLGVSVATAIKETPRAQKELDDEIDRKLFTSTEQQLQEIGAKIVEDEEYPYVENGYDGKVLTRNGDGECTKIVVYQRKKVLTPWEKFKAVAPVYWPCALSTGLSAACIIGSNVVSNKRYLGLAALAATQTKRLDEYKDKVKELFGEKKAEEVKREIANDHTMDCPREIIEKYQPGLKYPMEFCGYYFLGSKAQVESAFNRWNLDGIASRNECPFDVAPDIYLEDLAYNLPIEIHDPWMLQAFSWSLDKGAVSPKFVSCETPEGVPCFSIEFSRKPDNIN